MRLKAIDLARTWLGTPYVEGASQRGIASDCVGLIEGISRDLGLICPSRTAMKRDLVAAAHLFLVPTEDPRLGCVILFSQSPGGPPEHAGLMGDDGRFIHAHWTAGVVENRYSRWFRTRTSHLFDWPDLSLSIQAPAEKGSL